MSCVNEVVYTVAIKIAVRRFVVCFVGVSALSDVGQKQQQTTTKQTKYFHKADSLTYFSTCTELKTKPEGLKFMQTGHSINPWQSTKFKGAERRITPEPIGLC